MERSLNGFYVRQLPLAPTRGNPRIIVAFYPRRRYPLRTVLIWGRVIVIVVVSVLLLNLWLFALYD